MYLHQIRICNFRSIKDFELKFDQYAGWHVIIGDNGAGKSTLARAIALAMIGPFEAPALRQNWDNWLRYGESKGSIQLEITPEPKFDKTVKKGENLNKSRLPVRLELNMTPSRRGHHVLLQAPETEDLDPKTHIWGEGEGWFSASYGPFRRFEGSDRDYDKLFYSNPKLAPHLSVFGEEVALTECLNWLQDLHIKQLEGQAEGQILDALRTFLNEGRLLPHGTVLKKVSSEAIVFLDGNGCTVPVEQLSDGYRSILSMSFELIRQLVRTYGIKKVFQPILNGRMEIDLPGIVLIDEIDAHLHPSWQRQVGLWFRQYFPKLQFIVTTHSPLVCQAAEPGTVWRLPAPSVDDYSTSGRVVGTELQRLVYGNVLEALDTDLFGIDVTRSE